MSNQHNIVDISIDFNKYIKKFIFIIEKSMTNTDQVDYFNKLRRKIEMVIEHEPLLILKNGGPYIYDFREEIFNNDINRLLNECDIDNVSEYIVNEVKDENMNQSDEIKNLIKCLRTVWFNYNELEKKTIIKLLKRIISEYSKYLLINT